VEKVSFTKRYVLALSIIAILSTLAYVNLDKLISIQSDDGKLINISGQQKILAQQIAFHAIYYKIKNLEGNIKKFESNHKQLLSSYMSPRIKKAFFEKPMMLDKKVKDYLYHAKKFNENRAGKSLTYLLKHSNSLLKDLDSTVLLYLDEAKKHIEQLKKVEFYIFLMTLTTLFFEALFIFRPANRKIANKTNELIKEKDYSNTVIESSTNAIITINKNLEIKTFNKMAENIFGYTRDEMIGKTSFEKIIPDCRDLTTHEKKEEVREINAINKKGKIFPIRISFGSSSDDMIVANIQDISVEKLNDKILQQQSKFAALGEMIAIIAHQWRQPLAELSFNCMYIKRKLKDNELAKEAEKNQKIIQFMSETITNFQDFYKKSENVTFNPSLSIKQALSIVDSILHLNQIKLIMNVESQIKIFGNANSLAHVVLSILQNIIDIVKLKQIKDPFIKISLYDTSTHIILEIEDNAGGIKVNPIEDIFKPFHSKKQNPSTGIGLYMSKLVIQNQFNGTIEAQNSNNGAKFIIKLPHKLKTTNNTQYLHR
jgi:PAS domain S-box-containing protein